MLTTTKTHSFMRPEDVNPADWTDHEVIYNDEDQEYAVTWGKYQGILSLGTRWNGSGNARGYPGQGGYPLWFVEPDFLILPILQRIYLEALKTNEKNSSGELYSDKISKAIREFLSNER